MARHTPGNYVPLDVNYPRDEAIRRAGEHAELLFVRGLAYAKGTRTCGFIPDFDLDVVAVGLRNVRQRVDALVREKLWIKVSGGWLIRSWKSWNEAGDRALQRQSAGGSKGNHERWHVGRLVTDAECQWCTGSDDEPASNIAPRSVPDSGTDIAPRSESESQGKGREGKELPSSPRGEVAGFAEFYDAYPRKVGRKDAATKFAIAARTVDPATLVARAAAFAADPNLPTDKSKIPHPATWLHQGRWDDEALPARLDDRGRQVPDSSRRLTGSEMDDLLGADVWSCPPAPPGLDDDEGFEWRRARILEHAEERQVKARQRLGRTA